MLRRAGGIGLSAVLLSTLLCASALAAPPPGTIAYGTAKALWTFHVDETDGGVHSKVFAQHGLDPCCPVFSPDGTMVMFLTRSEEGKSSLRIAHLETGTVEIVAGTQFNPDLGEWSRGGTQVAFQAFSKRKKGLWVAGVNRSGRERVFSKNIDDGPSWSSDDSKLAFTILKKHQKTQVLYAFLNAPGVYGAPIDPAFNSYHPVWSPTDDVLAFTTYDDGPITSLYTVDVAVQDPVPTRLTDEGDSAYAMDWSPDGSTIVFDACCQVTDRETIVTIAPDGTNRTELVMDDDAGGVDSSFALHGYSPDGNYIAYTTNDLMGSEFDSRIHTMDADGGNQLERTGGEENFVYFIDWGPDSTSLLLCEEILNSSDSNINYLTGEDLFLVAAEVPGCDADWGVGGPV